MTFRFRTKYLEMDFALFTMVLGKLYQAIYTRIIMVSTLAPGLPYQGMYMRIKLAFTLVLGI